ncbi:MAG: aspartate kinase [bacterium]|nr:aspartate kinase [bacterium]
MKIVVLKFGGTSVADERGRENLAKRIREAIDDGFSPVAVVSAMGRYPAPYATDTLLSLFKPWGEPTASEKDMLMACGEIISAVIVTQYLRSQGMKAAAFSGADAGIRTSGAFGNASIEEINTFKLRQALEQGVIPVVAGFQGITAEGETATLGRGGSDTTAAALGAALGAARVDIFTDVAGVMTADPRQVDKAKMLHSITYTEIGEMAHEGAKVLHPRAVDTAEAHSIPLAVRSTFESSPGTVIGDESVRIFDRHKAGKVATGVVCVSGYCAVSVDFSLAADIRGGRLQVMDKLADALLSLDMINLVTDRLYFLIKEQELEKASVLLADCGFGFSVRKGCAKVSVIGQGMRGQPGVMRSICRALSSKGIELIYSTDSHITISCVVPHEHMRQAAQALHDEFGLNE